MIGPATAGAALGAGWGGGLFLALVAACGLTAVAGLRLARHLPPGTDVIGAS